MEVFKPFIGQNYFNKFEKSNNFSRFVCPYNFVVNSYEKSLELSKNEHNVYNFKHDKEAKENIKNWIEGSVLVTSKSNAFYIYEMSYKVGGSLYSILGIVGVLKLPQDGDEYVKVCEDVIDRDVEENFEFLKDAGFSSSPICSFVEVEKDIKFSNIVKNKMASSYIFKAKQKNVVHKIWKIEDEETINFLVDFFKNKVYYIFSGVEKFKAHLKYRDYLKDMGEATGKEDYILNLTFLKEDLSFTMLPFHRVVSGTFCEEDILKKLAEYFTIKHYKTLDSMRSTLFNFRREGKIAFGIYVDESYTVVNLEDKSFFEKISLKDSGYEEFNSFILDRLLEDFLKIKREDISYICVDRFATDAVNCGDACFCVYSSAVRSSEFFDILKQGKKLPSKSYSFFPNPVEGLLFYVID